MKACVEPAARDARIMTPALAHTFVFCTPVTRATISPLPFKGWYTKWKASAVFQMSAPAPRTVKTPEAKLADPAGVSEPTSVCCHGLGSPVFARVVALASFEGAD